MSADKTELTSTERIAEINAIIEQAREERKQGGEGISRADYKKLMAEKGQLEDELAIAKHQYKSIGDLEKELDAVQEQLAKAAEDLKAGGEKMPYEQWRALADQEKELSSAIGVKRDRATVKRIAALRDDPVAYSDEIKKMGALHNYSIANTFGFMIERPDVTRVANRATWEERGMAPKAGERAMWVNTPIFKTRKRKGPDGKWIPKLDSNGKQMLDSDGKKMWEETKTRIGFKYIRGAWDINQLEIVDEEKYEQASKEKAAELKDVYNHYLGVAKDLGIEVMIAGSPECPRKYNRQFLDGKTGGFYDPAAKTIVLAPEHDIHRRLGTLFHEIGHHVLGHGANGTKKEYAVNELEAETLAQYLAGRYGVNRDFSDAYRASWSRDIKQEEILSALSVARKQAHKLHSAHAELTVQRGLDLSVPLENDVNEQKTEEYDISM